MGVYVVLQEKLVEPTRNCGGVYEGLWLALQNGFTEVELQVDFESVVKNLSGNKQGCAARWVLIREICALLSDNWRVPISNTYGEGNICANVLASLACSIESEFLMF